MTKILLADLFPDALTDALRALVPAGCMVERVASASPEDFARAAADADVLVCAFRRIDRAALEVAPKVRLVQQFGIGYDNLDVAAIAAAGVAAGYCPGFNSVAVAEHTVLLMLAALRRFADGEGATRQGRFPQMAF
ncbi:MAG TPA: hydroxyacid dehydrogenase, partial [Acidimicrobiia bacterium]|nr:hydroxyacid dehydrogenase [Acidimicrobiia bacterium]